MYPMTLVKPWKALLCLALTATVTGCGGGGSSDEAPVEEPFLTAQGNFLTGIYDPPSAEGVYLEGSISGRGRWGASNLALWDTKPRDGAAVNLLYDDPLDLYIRDTLLGRLSYRATQRSWGAIEPDGNVFFIAGPSQKLLVSARVPRADEELLMDDLKGRFTCLRSFSAPQDRLQLLTATFTPETPGIPDASSTPAVPVTGAVDFEVIRDTSGEIPAPYAGRYELDANGRFRLTDDQGVAMETPGAKQEVLRGGAFQKQEQFLFASYMVAETKPMLADLVEGDPSPSSQEVPTSAFLACLKGGMAMTEDSLSGDFWYAEIAAGRKSADADYVYQQTYGQILVNGAGRLSRDECKSPAALIRREMSYQVEADGQLVVVADDGLQLQGILSHDGSLALVVNEGSELGFSFDIWAKKPRSSGCPTD